MIGFLFVGAQKSPVNYDLELLAIIEIHSVRRMPLLFTADVFAPIP